MSIATHYILTNNTGALITLPNFQTISPGLSAALSIHDYLLYCQYSQEFLQQADNGDITVQYYTGDPVIVPKPATASLKPIQEIYMPTDGRLAFTAPVSGVPPNKGNHLALMSTVQTVSGAFETTFGQYRYWASDETESGTTSSDWQTKLTVTIPASAVDVNRIFRIAWFAEFYDTNSGKLMEVRLYNMTQDVETGFVSQNQLPNSTYFFTGFRYVEIEESTTWEMQWRRASAPGTVYIHKARIEVWSVAEAPHLD